jgi:hypothetical protein
MKMNFSVLEKQKNMNYNMNNYLDVKRDYTHSDT